MDAPANPNDFPSPLGDQSFLDPQLAGYELLRRLVCSRAPFDALGPEKSAIPDEFKTDVEFGTWAYQISLYLEAVRIKFGLPVSEKIRTHLLFLSAFDASLKSRLIRFFEAIMTAEEKYADPRYAEFFDDPAVRYYAVLAIVFLIVSGCPEERQRPLVAPVMEHVVLAHAKAESVFKREFGSLRRVGDSLPSWRAPNTENDKEVGSIAGVSESFLWSAQPGPHERQLRRQQNNPLFPAAARAISAGQVNDARIADLERMSGFMRAYRPVVTEALSRKPRVVKQASDLEKAMIDLIPSCVVVGDYFSNELKFLESISDAIDQELARTTEEPIPLESCQDEGYASQEDRGPPPGHS